ncbi:MAG: glutamate--tRNA ligase [Archangium gephyra]|uniref:Glutamate--tRNA ligase n=1 Tax=Archangium gephyra TaxID=48 RepID=A0A2W5TXE5_9BACT|nr:MAG: glutamate--tRNA ligase [Archangium gephyra]
MTPRVRFAPSPTGYLHIGGARTALWNWLYARRFGGTFVLRMEDTDQERSTPESVKAILDGLRWLGIDWDEGPEVGGPFPPYFQMEKIKRYHQVADELIAQGKAYRDYTTEEETAQLRKDFAASKGLTDKDDLRKAGFKYSSPWRDKNEKLEKPHVIRFKMQPRGERIGFDDLVLGRLEKPDDDLDDFVLLRTDGIPLYNFGCVVDDHDMQISHVGRGQEHINSTYSQIALYQALGWAPPVFAHFPLILGQNNEKLSKRKHPEADVMAHQRNGMLPHALLNFICRLGWSHGNDELFTREQMVEFFDLKDVGKTNGVWNEKKLLSINEHWLKTLPPAQVASALVPYLKNVGVEAVVDAKLETAVKAFAPRAKTLVDMAASIKPYYAQGVTMDPAAAAKHLDAAGKDMLSKAKEKLLALPEWTAVAIDPIVDVIATETGAKKGAIAQPIRVAATGGTTSPGIGDTLVLLGRDETMRRIDSVLGS